MSSHNLHATWVPGGQLFFWTTSLPPQEAIIDEFPEIADVVGDVVVHTIAHPGLTVRRKPTRGFLVSVSDALVAFSSLPRDADVSESVRCWSFATLLGLELGARQRVVPTAADGRANWRVLLTRKRDRERFDVIVRGLPTVSRSHATHGRGPVRLNTANHVVREYLDSVVDALYRRNVYPGTTRGWALEFAEALRGNDAGFIPRDARYQGIPEKLGAWSSEGECTGLRLGLTLEPPKGARQPFKLSMFLHPVDAPDSQILLDDAWKNGSSIEVDGKDFGHPAHVAVNGLARAKRVFPPIGAALAGSRPKPLKWNAQQTWKFLSEGVGVLEDAGFEIAVPEEFARAGRRRIRARMRIHGPEECDGHLVLGKPLRFRWEVTLGDMVLSGDEFTDLIKRKQPIVQFRGEWILLDPDELSRLPDGSLQQGEVSVAEGLRAVLTGELNGVPVVTDDRLDLLIRAMREPPAVPAPTGLRGTLRPYQAVGFSWLHTLGQIGLGACLADDMGLGKTIQVISHILARRQKCGDRPCLVVCPTSVLGNWLRELNRFAPSMSVVRYHGLDRETESFQVTDVVLTTYGLLVRDEEQLTAINWDVVTLDEAQCIKNPDSQRARVARGLNARHRVALSGTPIENRLDELWSIMEFLVPGFLGKRGTFRRNIAVPIERFGDVDVARKLRLGVSPFLLRRMKSDPKVISDLPEKLERNLYCPLTSEQARLYEQVVEEHMQSIAEAAEGESSYIARRGRVLAMLTALKQVCNHPLQYSKEKGKLLGRSGKFDRTMYLIDAIFDAGERVLLFTQYREMGSLLAQEFERRLGETVPFLHGGVPGAKRDEMVRRFQEDDDAPPIMLVSLRAGGTGLNLTRATHVIHYDRWWNPAVEDQATDRAYRIGQRRDVSVHKLICQGTLEERIAALLEDKRALAESIVGTGERLVTDLDDAALRALVQLGDDAVLEEV